MALATLKALLLRYGTSGMHFFWIIKVPKWFLT
jgi:hypothetical protein